MHLLVLVLGVSLERVLETPLARRLAANSKPCKASCDAGHDRECDTQDSCGQWTLSCDLHPTKSCDADCHHSPPPLLDPWMGASGTYPSPPLRRHNRPPTRRCSRPPGFTFRQRCSSSSASRAAASTTTRTTRAVPSTSVAKGVIELPTGAAASCRFGGVTATTGTSRSVTLAIPKRVKHWSHR